MENETVTIQSTVRYGDTDYQVRLERRGSRGEGYTFAGYVSRDLYRIGNSLVVDAVAQHTGVTPEVIRRECSATSFRGDDPRRQGLHRLDDDLKQDLEPLDHGFH